MIKGREKKKYISWILGSECKEQEEVFCHKENEGRIMYADPFSAFYTKRLKKELLLITNHISKGYETQFVPKCFIPQTLTGNSYYAW